MAKKRYQPKSDAKGSPWLLNFNTEFRKIALAMGMSEAEIIELEDKSTLTTGKIANTNTAKTDWLKTRADKDSTKEDCYSSIGAALDQLQSNPKWLPSYNKALWMDTASSSTNYDTYRPEVTAKITGGKVQVRIVKLRVHALDIMGENPDGSWTLLERITGSKWTDPRPLAVPGVVETRRYMVRGVKNDKLVGQPSEIITVHFAG